jgi:hypothetical protein
MTSGSNYGNRVRINESGILSISTNTTTSTNAAGTGTTALSPDTWYHIEVLLVVSGGILKVWLNGALEISVSGVGVNDAANHSRVFLGKGVNISGASVDFCYDDFFWVDGDNDGPVGQVLLGTQTADADGTDTGWTAGTNSSNYLEVDDGFAHDSGTTYKQSAASTGDAFTVNMTSASSAGISGTILGVSALTVVIRVSTSNVYAARLRVGSSTLDNSSGSTLSTTYVVRGICSLVDPSTSAAWTTSGIDALQVGGVLLASPAVRCTSAVSYVGYVPGAAAVTSFPPQRGARSFQHMMVR